MKSLLLLSAFLLAAQAGLVAQPSSKRAYREQRAALIAKAGAESFDHDLRLTAEEKKANAKFVRLRDSLLDAAKRNGNFPWARYFYGAQNDINQSPMFSLLQKMPKAAITHLHTSATGSMRWVVRTAIAEPNCFVRWTIARDTTGKATGGTYQSVIDPAGIGTIAFFKPGTEPAGFVSAGVLASTVWGFADSLYNLLTFGQAMGDDTAHVWKAFEERFDRIDGFDSYRPMFKQYYRMAFDSLIADGVQVVELRAGLGTLYDLDHPSRAKDGYYTKDTTLALFRELQNEIRKDHPEFTLKIIYCGYRFASVDQITADLARAFRMRKKNPDMIKGYDLVGEEDAGYSTLFYLDAWLKSDSLARVYGIDMPFYFHDGETDRPDVENLYDAVLLHSRRIGHGFNLFQYPSLVAAVKKQDICIEVSPLSNQILGYVRDLRIHPACGLLRQGVQYTISSDDPGIFGYSGLTYDYWSAVMAWNLDLRAVKKLLLNSFTYGTLSTRERTAAVHEFEKRWLRFIRGI